MKMCKRLLALALCCAMVLGIMPALTASAVGDSVGSSQDSKLIYANANETTYVPAGYTYVYVGENGQVFTREAQQDMYVTGRVLTSEEAEALASLEYGEEGYMVDENGNTVVCREYDAKAAAEFSDAIQAILGDFTVADDEKVSVVSEVYSARTPVRALITFEDAPVADMDGMTVALSRGIGEAEVEASRAIEAKQMDAVSKMEKSLGYEIEVNSQFSLLTNAVSATVNYGDLAAIRQMSGVKSAIVMPSYSMPEINAATVDGDTYDPDMRSVVKDMGVTGAWDCGYTGEGMSVAVIDTGLCFENPSFPEIDEETTSVAYTKGDIAKILTDYDLKAEELADIDSYEDVYYNSKIPFGFNYADGEANHGSDDDTWYGHGTHVAGIVAGTVPEDVGEEYEMDTMGIAPDAQLIIMKVFDYNGYCYFDYLINALEDAIILGVDCANLSLGSPCGPVELDGVTEVYDRAVAAGINVVVSAGNEAHAGVGSYWGNNMVKSDSVSTGVVGMPGSFDSVLTVASADNSEEVSFYAGYITWWDDFFDMRCIAEYAEIPDVPEGMGFMDRLKGQSFVYTDNFADAEGKIVFYPFAGGNADDVIAEAAEAGAAGLVLTGRPASRENDYTFVEVEATRYDVPTCVSDTDQYDFLKSRAPSDGVVRVDQTWNPSRTAGQMSDFSSWGPTEGLTIKPEITGIGGNVFSAYYGPYFAIASGTSMSSPAVAASAALVRQYLREEGITTDQELTTAVNCLLMSTATPIFDEEHSAHYFVRRQGAGLANVSAAITSGAYITVKDTNKAKLELGSDTEKTGVYDMTFQVVNFSDVEKTYDVKTNVLGQIAEGGQFKNGKVTYLTVEYAQDRSGDVTVTGDTTVTVPAGETVEVHVTVAMNDEWKAYYDERFPSGGYVEGFVRLVGTDTPDLTVPFLGFYGDFDDAPILEEGDYSTIIGGTRSYTTADQFHDAIWSSKRISEDDRNFLTDTYYLGDTSAPGNHLIPTADYDFETMYPNFYPFYAVRAGISPNGDDNVDALNIGFALRRNAENVHYTVTNVDTGEILWEQDTEFMQKTYTSSYHIGEELDLGWLYQKHESRWGVYYDYDHCLLPNNTQVEIKIDVTPEGQTEATQSKAFTFYIDTEEPVPDSAYTIGTEVEFWPWDDEPFVMYTFRTDLVEYWFMDYSLEIELDYDPEADEWWGFAGTDVYFGSEPMRGDGGYSQTSTSMFDENSILITGAYDYAGNISMREIRGSDVADFMDLTVDKTTILVGDTATVTDVAVNNFNTELYWEVSDPEIAEIVESDAHSVTIKGLQTGTVTVTSRIGKHTKSVEINVVETLPEWPFVDVAEDDWFYDSVKYVYENGIMVGTSGTTFSPYAPMTRGMLAAVIYRMEGSPSVAGITNTYTDVSGSAYYCDAITWATANHILYGVGGNKFEPDRAATREEMVTIFYRYANYKGVDTTARADLSGFDDCGDVSAYAEDAISWAVAEGVIYGTTGNCIKPGNSSTRGEVAAVITRYAANVAQ